jgi:hypothetical protein
MENKINEKIFERMHKKSFKLIYQQKNENKLTEEKEYKEFISTEPKHKDIAYWKDKEHFSNYLILSQKKLYLLRIHKPTEKENIKEIQLYELESEQ